MLCCRASEVQHTWYYGAFRDLSASTPLELERSCASRCLAGLRSITRRLWNNAASFSACPSTFTRPTATILLPSEYARALPPSETKHQLLKPARAPSVREAEVQPLVAFVRGGTQVVGLLFLGHRIPNFLPPPIDGHIEHFRAHENADVPRDDAEEDLVTGIVIGLVGFAIDLESSAYKLLERGGWRLTLLPMMLLACTHMLYNALATVRVRTVPAFRLVMATISACTYG